MLIDEIKSLTGKVVGFDPVGIKLSVLISKSWQKKSKTQDLGDGPENWHIFLFSVAYFPSYRHMPLQYSPTDTLSAHII